MCECVCVSACVRACVRACVCDAGNRSTDQSTSKLKTKRPLNIIYVSLAHSVGYTAS